MASEDRNEEERRDMLNVGVGRIEAAVGISLSLYLSVCVWGELS